jgi:hypothetical protein
VFKKVRNAVDLRHGAHNHGCVVTLDLLVHHLFVFLQLALALCIFLFEFSTALLVESVLF